VDPSHGRRHIETRLPMGSRGNPQKSPIHLQKSPIYPQKSPAYVCMYICICIDTTKQDSPWAQGVIRKRALYVCAKEPNISAKEPYTSAKEPCISAKEPCICMYIYIYMYIHIETRLPMGSRGNPQKSPIHSQTSPIYPQESPAYVCMYIYIYMYTHRNKTPHGLRG